MEKRHRCKLCFRNFANGRALGGHMRSHMMKFYEEARKKQEEYDDFQSTRSFSSTSISPSSSEEEEKEEEGSGEVKALLVDNDFYVAVQDRESETESSKKKNRVRKRSKRVPKPRIPDFNGYFQVKKKLKLEKDEEKRRISYEHSSLSSISDTTPEEHVAHCLIMLSRDKWRRAEVKFQAEEEEALLEGERKLGDDYSEDSGVAAKVIKSKVRGKYRCAECSKLFKSYQALGGHRASHRKIRYEAAAAPNASTGGGQKAAAAEEKLHECPFCQRVFPSGQALGGHKRSHFIGSGSILGNGSNTSPAKQNSRNCEILLNIDLNLPAPIDDEENSQVAVSAVSDAEFVHPIKQ